MSVQVLIQQGQMLRQSIADAQTDIDKMTTTIRWIGFLTAVEAMRDTLSPDSMLAILGHAEAYA